MLHRLLYVVAALSIASGFLIPSSVTTDDHDHQCEGNHDHRIHSFMPLPGGVQYETMPVRYQYPSQYPSQPDPSQFRNQYTSYGGTGASQGSLLQFSGAREGGMPYSTVSYDNGAGRYGYGAQEGTTGYGGGYNMKQYDGFNGQMHQMMHQRGVGTPYGAPVNGAIYKSANTYTDHGMVPIGY